jgi:Ni/Fe-hydrogenase subunit HybB-like protein
MALDRTGEGSGHVEQVTDPIVAKETDEITEWSNRLTSKVLAPTRSSGRWYRVWVIGLLVVIAWGFVAYAYQWRQGLYVTGMRDRISWGLYISAFVFFIGISHAGTLISAILRAADASWRTPITRIAESITVVSLVTGALFVVVDMGRPERLYQFWLNGNWQSPLMWDMMAITIYLTGSVIYLYVPMIPDLAMFHEELSGANRLQRWGYRTLAIGWENNDEQRHMLHKSINLLMLLIIPIAVSVHTVVSWIFAMTTRVSWDSTIFGFFFVAGAIYSGIATLIIVLAVMRRAYHLEEYITPLHFKYLGYLLVTLSLVMLYGNASEYITKGFKVPDADVLAFEQLFAGTFAPMFWFYFFGGLVLPILVVACKPTRTVTGLVVAAVFVDLAMFLERYFIVVGGLRVPTMPYEPPSYAPTWVEWSILASGTAGFMLLLTLFARFFPILAVWEMKEERIERTAPAEPEGELAP